ncbi:heme-copper oxidase subunit III family protein [Photobacterium sp. ZSDE20]|uniref:Heme-copper oxidase subunit III family protein n=1 Tax=Photobacterium pectinilyticum TaxID=2906793 RepID=A0ABT1N8J7_9GAMM|nr:heme-copper oxidase subunit III family protein [Photobacterium sp. ZSDE20]MCQ1060857.1 heme-copper oxidase subunit III family protein [Photobacterium sp. ZSDE20]MDD1828680.1 heme-copper oxidase subunit III family protein [Photobacterium sp. ZSDE20]
MPRSIYTDDHPTHHAWASIVNDYSADKAVFNVSSNKTMMWIFLLSDIFVFGCFLVGYMAVRMTTTEPWPIPSDVFALTIAGQSIPLVLIAIMTFILITSSGTMAMAVNCGYQQKRGATALLMLITALFGLSFVGMQAFEWTKLIEDGFRPWENEAGATQFGACFFMITGFHGLHVSVGVIYLLIVAWKVWRGDYECRGSSKQQSNYEIVEIAGLYWHFVDLVWVFIFAFFYLW